MADNRSYTISIDFEQQNYLPGKWDILIDTAMIKSNRFDTVLTLVRLNERQLGGVYHF